MRERQAETDRRKAEARKKLVKKISIIAAPVIVVVIAAFLLVTRLIIPNGKYNDALALMDAGEYTEAFVAFEALGSYKDSANKVLECKYNIALALSDAGKYEEAIVAFGAMGGYKDSDMQMRNCNIAILDGKYNDALALVDAGKYEEAIAAFTDLGDYKNSKKQIETCETAILDEQYDVAIELANAEKYSEAIAAFEALNGYKDSTVLAEQCLSKYWEPILAGKWKRSGFWSNPYYYSYFDVEALTWTEYFKSSTTSWVSELELTLIDTTTIQINGELQWAHDRSAVESYAFSLDDDALSTAPGSDLANKLKKVK